MSGLRRVRLHAFLELLPRAEGHHGAGRNGDLFAGLGIAPRALVLAPQVEIAEAGKLHLAALLEGFAQHLEERIDEFLRLAFVQADFLVEPLGHLGLRKCHALTGPQLRMRAPWSRSSVAVTRSTTPSTSRSFRVRDLSSRIKPIARLLKPLSTPLPWYTSNSRSPASSGPALARIEASSAAHGTSAATTKARSRRTEGYRPGGDTCGSARLRSGSRSTSKPTTAWSRSSSRSRRGCSSPIQPMRLPSRWISAERPGWAWAGADGRYSRTAPAHAARLSRSPLRSW